MKCHLLDEILLFWIKGYYLEKMLLFEIKCYFLDEMLRQIRPMGYSLMFIGPIEAMGHILAHCSKKW